MSETFRSQYRRLFVSHARPEDNYFATWLTTKLRLIGYETWCDLDELKGGEDFWRDIETVIRQETAKFLFVVSEASLQKRGTLSELAVADKIRDRGDFIIPLKLGDTSYNSLPIELIRLNHIEFSRNWADGLKYLLDKLEKDQVPKFETSDSQSILQLWNQGLSVKTDTLIERDEAYWTNWFEIKLPEFLYLHMPTSFENISLDQLKFPFLRDGVFILTFACSDCFRDIVSLAHSERVEVGSFLAAKTFQTSVNKHSVMDTNKKVINLLNQAINQLFKRKGLRKQWLSDGTAYYFSSDGLNEEVNVKVGIKKFGRRSIQLTGQSKDLTWHFALSGESFLYPVAAYFLRHHVVFTKDGSPVDKKVQHSARRRIGKNWYNKKWRDLMLGAMLKLSDGEQDQTISLPVCCQQSILMNSTPIQLRSTIGYLEPKSELENEQESNLS